MTRKQKILVIIFKGIGDVILTIPTVEWLKKQTGADIYFFTKKASQKALMYHPDIKEVFVREEHPDVTIDFAHNFVSAITTLISLAKKRLAFTSGKKHGYLGRIFYNIIVPKQHAKYPYCSVTDKIQITETLGIKYNGEVILPKVYYKPENEENVKKFLSDSGIKDDDKVVIFDTTSIRASRRWTQEKFARIADLMKNTFNVKIIFLGVAGSRYPEERLYVEDLVKMCKEKHILYPKHFSLLDLAALTKKSALLFGTNSAPMHIAVSQGTPCFTLCAAGTVPNDWNPPMDKFASVHCVESSLPDLPFEKVWDSFLEYNKKNKIL